MSTPDTTTARPTFTTTACVLASCYDCGHTLSYDGYDGGKVHFPTADAARGDLEAEGWSRAHDTEPSSQDIPDAAERWRCPSCIVKRTCATSGHLPYTVGAWSNPRTGVEHLPWQLCERCDAELTAPVSLNPPTDYPTETPTHEELYWDRAGLPEGADLAEAAQVLIRQADTIGWLNRWDAYLTTHPDATVPGNGQLLDIPAGIAAADRLITLATALRDRLTHATIPATTTHMAITNAPH
ncbi:hypothetical protein [Streptosporangium sp. NBC_01469]|uniref:hypothetical protein n=1 Tax=Streptosporangium sp. NBC_01469 TaxID=2903898 RepID=UPI002E298A92|nr:hypothetical protein [Streptosporangium sp. NBC_01469]